MSKKKKVINITSRTNAERVRKLFRNAFDSKNPVNLKLPEGYHYAFGDLYFKLIGDDLFSYQQDQCKWVGPL